MDDDRHLVRSEGSRVVQGCLFGAVLLFVLLLVTILFLAYQRFREHTLPPPQTLAASLALASSPRIEYASVVLAAESAEIAEEAIRNGGVSAFSAPYPGGHCFPYAEGSSHDLG